MLDIADLFRDTITLQIAFTVAKKAETDSQTIDRLVIVGEEFDRIAM